LLPDGNIGVAGAQTTRLNRTMQELDSNWFASRQVGRTPAR
jgi:hypothetical protein